MKKNGVAIYGASGFGREVAWLAKNAISSRVVLCFIDDDKKKYGQKINGIPVFDLEKTKRLYPEIKVIFGIGNPGTKEILATKVKKEGLDFDLLIHRSVDMSEWVEIKEGSIICSGSILTTNIKIGMHVHINLNCTIGHDVVLGDYTTLSPGVHISGCVVCGKRVFVGSGAVVANGTQIKPVIIGDDAIIGAGSVVLDDVPDGALVAGVPARIIKRRADR